MRKCLRTFSAVAMNFSTVAMDVSKEKVLSVALPFGLFLQLQWKVRFFYSYDGNPNPIVVLIVIGNF
jgi:hypothetical protein